MLCKSALWTDCSGGYIFWFLLDVARGSFDIALYVFHEYGYSAFIFLCEANSTKTFDRRIWITDTKRM